MTAAIVTTTDSPKSVNRAATRLPRRRMATSSSRYVKAARSTTSSRNSHGVPPASIRCQSVNRIGFGCRMCALRGGMLDTRALRLLHTSAPDLSNFFTVSFAPKLGAVL
jgi:hypothetical protein